MISTRKHLNGFNGSLHVVKRRTILEDFKKRGEHVMPSSKGVSNKFDSLCWCGFWHRVVQIAGTRRSKDSISFDDSLAVFMSR